MTWEAPIGLALGRLMNRRWYFRLQWQPSCFSMRTRMVPTGRSLRRSGVRTEREIDEERYALKLMRGHFSGMDQESRKPVDAVMEAIRR